MEGLLLFQQCYFFVGYCGSETGPVYEKQEVKERNELLGKGEMSADAQGRVKAQRRHEKASSTVQHFGRNLVGAQQEVCRLVLGFLDK